jgi:hypothetical protein
MCDSHRHAIFPVGSIFKCLAKRPSRFSAQQIFAQLEVAEKESHQALAAIPAIVRDRVRKISLD